MAPSYFVSLPSNNTPALASPCSAPTNALAITPLPRDFFQPRILDVLRAHFASFGTLSRWVPMPGFGRILVVYTRAADAETAKRHCDPIVLRQTHARSQLILRVYRADPSPLLSPNDDAVEYLRPPPVEKNFLLSPPGSPPVGWVPAREDPPNATPARGRPRRRAAQPADITAKQARGAARAARGRLLAVGVYVQDCCGDEDSDVWGEEWTRHEKWSPLAALPPVVVS
ncbi:Calcipressin-domain-containing protein [Mycena rebaudengoi]|nr:Calcipressin-domain-containing protein [Mycena rebaudengoi]